MTWASVSCPLHTHAHTHSIRSLMRESKRVNCRHWHHANKPNSSPFSRLTSFHSLTAPQLAPIHEVFIKNIVCFIVCVCVRAHTQNGVTMTTGSCVSVQMRVWERGRERERCLYDGSRWGLNCIMAELHGGFHQGHSGFAFWVLWRFLAEAQEPRDVPFKSGIEGQNPLCCQNCRHLRVV